MNGLYRFIRSVQDTTPPIRARWVAMATYAVLATVFAMVLPTLAERINNMIKDERIIEFAIFGAIYGHCKWSIAVDRYWWRPRETYNVKHGEG